MGSASEAPDLQLCCCPKERSTHTTDPNCNSEACSPPVDHASCHDTSLNSCETDASLLSSGLFDNLTCGEDLDQEISARTDDLVSSKTNEQAQAQAQKQQGDVLYPNHRQRAAAEDVMRMASNENLHEVCPSTNCLDSHTLTHAHRSLVVSWLMEVVEVCHLHAATLFLAVSYFDRFLCVAKNVTPGMLQLLATASLSIAAKIEEVLQPTTAEWVAIADTSFSVEALVQMEFVILQYLTWKVRTPTGYTFLNLFSAGIAQLGDAVAKSACYLIELALLDINMLQFKYSTIAAAGLITAHQLHGLKFDLDNLLSLAPFVKRTDAESCASLLHALHLQCTQSDPGKHDDIFRVVQRRHAIKSEQS